MKPLILTTLAVAILTIGGCSKPENTNNTHTNAIYTDTSTSYLRCRVNGNTWHSTQDSLSCIWSNHRKMLVIKAYHAYGTEIDYFNFTMGSGDTIESGTWPLNDLNSFASYKNMFIANHDSISFKTGAVNTGGIYFGFNTAAKRIEGQFHFIGGTSNGNLANITDGEFSMPYTTTD